jgi:competence protein ComEC
MVFIAGLLRHGQFIEEVFPGSSLNIQHDVTGLFEVDEVLKQKSTTATLKCQILSLVDSTGEEIVRDKFIVLYVRNPGIRNFFPGDILMVKGQASALPAPMNPDAFDMRKYYRTISIRHQLRADQGNVHHMPMKVSSVMRTTALWQNHLCDIVRQNTSAPVAQLTNALVWGERKNMDDDIRKAFADSGAMHVLSVSGMHMAMIYSMLYLILGSPSSGTMLKRNIRLALYGIAIILYMGLTGACPAVVRSGLMILLYLLGKAMGWNTQIWNLLGFAAFLMIWSNPFVIYNIGFQLSFLAMAGILLYAKPLIRTFTFNSILIHRIWEVSAVSIAAQVFILPLLLFHFYQFPLTFIASSLVAMPASYVIIFGSLLNIIMSPLEWEWLWKMYDIASVWFIDIMKWMASLNPSMNYSLPNMAAWMMAAMAIFFSASLIYQWNTGRKIAWVLAIGIVLHLTTHRVKVWNAHELTIYHHYKGLLADIVADGFCYTLSDSLVTRESEDFSARGNRCRQDVIRNLRIQQAQAYTTRHWSYSPPIIQTHSKKIVLWNNLDLSPDASDLTHIIVQEPVRLRELENLLCAQQGITIIIPAHIRGYPLTKLKKIIQRTEATSVEINLTGAMVMEL